MGARAERALGWALGLEAVSRTRMLIAIRDGPRFEELKDLVSKSVSVRCFTRDLDCGRFQQNVILHGLRERIPQKAYRRAETPQLAFL